MSTSNISFTSSPDIKVDIDRNTKPTELFADVCDERARGEWPRKKKIFVSLLILFTLCCLLAQTLVIIETPAEEERRAEAREQYERAREAVEKIFFNTTKCEARGGSANEEENEKKNNLATVSQVELCRDDREEEFLLRFNESCLLETAPEASGVIEELPLFCSSLNETEGMYYYPIAEIYIHYIKDLEEKEKIMNMRQWNFEGAFFFVWIVCTTIGYGNVAPATNEGRLAVTLTVIPILAISLISIVTIAEPLVDGLNLFHKWMLKKMKKKIPIDITIPQRFILEDYFGVRKYHLIGEAFWPLSIVYAKLSTIFSQDERHKGEVFTNEEEFRACCERLQLKLRKSGSNNESFVIAVTNTTIEQVVDEESVLNLEEIRLLLNVIRSKAGLHQIGIQLIHCLLFSIFMVLLGTVYFAKIVPHWSYSEAAYFSIVSITSIGLGDYVPDAQKDASVAFWYPFVFIGFGVITVFIGTLATFAEKGREQRQNEYEFKYLHHCYCRKRCEWRNGGGNET